MTRPQSGSPATCPPSAAAAVPDLSSITVDEDLTQLHRFLESQEDEQQTSRAAAVELDPELKSELEPDPKLELESKLEPEPNLEPESKLESEPEPEPKLKSEPNSEPEPEQNLREHLSDAMESTAEMPKLEPNSNLKSGFAFREPEQTFQDNSEITAGSVTESSGNDGIESPQDSFLEPKSEPEPEPAVKEITDSVAATDANSQSSEHLTDSASS